jgi:hypothetical protein
MLAAFVFHTAVAQMPLVPESAVLCPLFAAQRGTADASRASPHMCPSIPAMRKWKKLKFGLFITWGAYSHRVPYDEQYPGASWKLDYFAAGSLGYWKASNGSRYCSKQAWGNQTCPTRAEMNAFRSSYWNMSKTFEPAKFNADALMKFAKRAGFKYVIPTTKHHDGFAMWNTSASGDNKHQPLYGVCGADSPLQRDLIGEISIAARDNGLNFGAYFSKADWHAGSYWVSPQTVEGATDFPQNTGPNYDWQSDLPANLSNSGNKTGRQLFGDFLAFNKQQLNEIVTKYNPELLWLDAPWLEQLCNETVGPRPLHTPQVLPCHTYYYTLYFIDSLTIKCHIPHSTCHMPHATCHMPHTGIRLRTRQSPQHR